MKMTAGRTFLAAGETTEDVPSRATIYQIKPYGEERQVDLAGEGIRYHWVEGFEVLWYLRNPSDEELRIARRGVEWGST